MSQKLREGFLWGNSVSSMQTEGGWNEDGKGLSVYDIREASEFASDWHFANDNYHHYEEDFDLMSYLNYEYPNFMEPCLSKWRWRIQRSGNCLL